MRKILIILLLISCKGESQVVINTGFVAVQVTTSNSSSFGIGGANFTAGKLYLFIAMTTGTTNNGSISSTSTTWTNVINTGNSTRRIQVFRCIPTVNASSEVVLIGTFGSSATGYAFDCWEITGIDATGTNGENAIIQAVAGGTTGADPSISMAAFASGRSSGIGLFFNSVNPFAGTAESGWTEDVDGGYDDPVTGAYFMYRNLTSDNTPTVTAASSDWIGVGIELKPSGRRIFNTN